MPAVKISSDTLHQMLLDTRSDIAEFKKQFSEHVVTLDSTRRTVDRIDGKLDRALTMETAVAEMRSDFDRAKGMGLLAAVLLGALEGLLGIVAFFRH